MRTPHAASCSTACRHEAFVYPYSVLLLTLRGWLVQRRTEALASTALSLDLSKDHRPLSAVLQTQVLVTHSAGAPPVDMASRRTLYLLWPRWDADFRRPPQTSHTAGFSATGLLEWLTKPTEVQSLGGKHSDAVSPFASVLGGSDEENAPLPRFTPVWLSETSEIAGTKASSPLLEEAHRMNAALRRIVREMQRDDRQGGLVSNIGGWQSRKNSAQGEHFFTQMSRRPGEDGWAVRRLLLHILHQTRSFLTSIGADAGIAAEALGDNWRFEQVGGEKLQSGNSRVTSDSEHKRKEAFFSVRESWVGINKAGDWNHEHAHGTAALAGVYYVDSGMGQGAEGGQEEEGTGLFFMDPRPGGKCPADNESNAFARRLADNLSPTAAGSSLMCLLDEVATTGAEHVVHGLAQKVQAMAGGPSTREFTAPGLGMRTPQ